MRACERPRPSPRVLAALLPPLFAISFAVLHDPWAGSAEAMAPEFRLSFGSIVPEDTPWAEEFRELKRRCERESHGKIKVTLFLNGRRGSENDMLSDVRNGKLQGCGISSGAVAAEVPELQALEFPFLFRDGAEVDAILDGPLGATLAARATPRGLVLALIGENGWRSIATRSRPVLSVDDLKGLKMRAQESPINAAFWKALGASYAPIPLNEVLSALRTGVIDGFDQTPLYMSAASWHTEVQHFTLTEHSYQGGCVVYNKRFLDALPEDLRRIVLADTELQAHRNRKAVRALNAEVVSGLAAEHIQVHRLGEREREGFRRAAERVYDQYRGTPIGGFVDRIEAALTERRRSSLPPPR